MKSNSLKDLIEAIIPGEWGNKPKNGSYFKVIRTSNFTNEGKLDLSKDVAVRDIDPKKFAKKKLRPGDIIIEKSGGSPTQPVGRVVYFDLTDEDYTTNNFTAILRPIHLCYPKYLFYGMYYLYKSGRTLSYQNKTTGIINLKLDAYLQKEKIPLPPLHIQKQIVQVLDEADALIQKRKQAIAKLDELVQSVFLEMFGDPSDTKKTTHTLEQVCEINPSLKKFQYRVEDEDTLVTFVPMDYVKTDGTVVVKELRKYKEVCKGYTFFTNKDVLCAKITPCFENGKIGIVNEMKTIVGFGSTEFHVLRSLEGISVPEFLCYLLRTSSVKKYLERNMTGSAGQKRVPKNVLKNLKIYLPPYQLQKRFEVIVKEYHKQKSLMQKQLAKLEENFNSLLQRAFKGELQFFQEGEQNDAQRGFSEAISAVEVRT